MTDSEVLPDENLVEDKQASKPLVEASVWRLGPGGLLLASVMEKHVEWLAEQEPDTIFFHADFSFDDLIATSDTMQKVHDALSSQGLQEEQITNVVSVMQNAGILFRERAV